MSSSMEKSQFIFDILFLSLSFQFQFQFQFQNYSLNNHFVCVFINLASHRFDVFFFKEQ